VDKLAKQAVKFTDINIKLNLSKKEIKGKIKEFINKKWQEAWNNGNKGRHMYRIQNEVGNGRRVFRNRREDTIISRIRIGHTRLNHSLFKIRKHNTGKCNYCDQDETIEHVLIKCEKYVTERLEFMKEVRKLGVEYFNMESILKVHKDQDKIFSAIIKFVKAIGIDGRI